MNVQLAEKLLRDTMDEYGLEHVKTKMNGRLTTVFGRYRYSSFHSEKSIELSVKLVEINDEERVMKTILHEIAHALTEGHGHDEVWQDKCLEIGGDGKRCYSSTDTNTIERKSKLLQAYCEEHGNRGRFYRRVNRACGSCCNQYSNGKYDERYRLQFREV